MLIGPSKNIANNGKGMHVGLKQPLGDGERCVTPARAAAKETMKQWKSAKFELGRVVLNRTSLFREGPHFTA